MKTTRFSAAVLLVVLLALLRPVTAQAQDTKCVYRGNDLYFLGSAIINKDKAKLEDIENADVKQFAKAVVANSTTEANKIARPALKQVALGWILKDEKKIDDVPFDYADDDDWYYFGKGVLDKNTYTLDNIKVDEDLKVLGLALIESDYDKLSDISYKTECCDCDHNPDDNNSTNSDDDNADEGKLKNFCCNDLYYLGRVYIDGTEDMLEDIGNDDVKQLAKALLSNKVKDLEGIGDDDLYYFGKGVILNDADILNKLVNDDIYWCGRAIQTGDDSYLDDIKNKDIYYFTKAILENDKDILDDISFG